MKQKLINSILSQTLFLITNGVLAIILVPILINMLGKINFGAFELIMSLVIVNFLLEFGLGSTLIKYIPEYKEDETDLKKFIWSYFYFKMFITVIGALIISIIGYYFNTIFNVSMIENIDTLKASVYIFAFGILLNSVATFLQNILNGFVYFAQVNASKTISVILFFIVAYAYYKFSSEYQIVEIAIIWFIIRPMIFILTVLFIYRKLNLMYLLVPQKFEYNFIRQTLKYLLGMSYITIIAQLYNRLPKIIFGIFLTPVYVGYWGIIERLKNPILSMQSAALRPLIPILSDKKHSSLSIEKILQASRLSYLLIVGLTLLVIMNVELIILNWLGNDFMKVVELSKVLFLPSLFPAAGVLLMMYYAEGKTKINQLFITLNTSVGIMLSTILLILFEDIMFFTYAYIGVLITLNIVFLLKYLNYFKINVFLYFKKVVFPIGNIILFVIVIGYFVNIYIPITLFGLFLGFMSTSFTSIIGSIIFLPKEDTELILKSKILTKLLAK
ncbi:MAG TPA: lipopolysaccharide biosynthesis protein [Arcobacter sp.]|nr:lipopolysaccharide biosynthesis protein [Arcobacter sp.]